MRIIWLKVRRKIVYEVWRARSRLYGRTFVNFLRDPVTRYVSAFNARYRKGRPRYYRPWSDAEKTAFQEFHSPNELARALSADNADTQRSATAAMTSIYLVNQPYTKWIGSADGLRAQQVRIARSLP
jgi:hypothetical protein